MAKRAYIILFILLLIFFPGGKSYSQGFQFNTSFGLSTTDFDLTNLRNEGFIISMSEYYYINSKKMIGLGFSYSRMFQNGKRSVRYYPVSPGWLLLSLHSSPNYSIISDDPLTFFEIMPVFRFILKRDSNFQQGLFFQTGIGVVSKNRKLQREYYSYYNYGNPFYYEYETIWNYYSSFELGFGYLYKCRNKMTYEVLPQLKGIFDGPPHTFLITIRLGVSYH